MIDTQNKRDHRNKAIKKVGIAGIKYPISVLDKINGVQDVNGLFNIYVDLSEHFKGTHMSRFIAILNKHRGQISTRTLRTVLSPSRFHR